MNPLIDLDRLLRVPGRMVALETADGAVLARAIGRLALRRGQACYHWAPGAGLSRFGGNKACIPDTGDIEGALHHVAGCRHFGIFVFTAVRGTLFEPSIVRQLHALNQERAGTPRTMILIDERIDLPILLQPDVVRFSYVSGTPVRQGSKRA